MTIIFFLILDYSFYNGPVHKFFLKIQGLKICGNIYK